MKDTVNMKRQDTDEEKIFTNHKSHKELVSRIYKVHLKLNKKTNNSIKTERKIWTNTSPKHTDGGQSREKMLNLLAIREMQVSIILWHPY